MTWQPDVMIYHASCDDGFGAAWAAWKSWGDSVEYVPAHYGQRPPEVLGKHVLIGDFSYQREGLDTCLQGAASVVILDHHKTAVEELAAFRFHESSPGAISAGDVSGMLRDLAELGRPPAIAIFDMARSGARMVWDFCHPGVPVPWLIRLIEDRDLWRFEHPQTKAFTSYLRSLPYDFDTWNDVAGDLDDPIMHPQLMREARGIRRFFEQQVEQIAGTAYMTTIGGHEVPTANCGRLFASEVGHALLTAHPDAPFAATWSASHGAIGYSLRSEDHRADVSEVARNYGGGGHRNAAGFGVPRS